MDSVRTCASVRFAKRFGGALLAAIALAVAGTAGPAHARSPERECPGRYVVTVPGTWETSADEPRRGMLAAALEDLPGDVRVDNVALTATAFPWEGDVYGRSEQEALDKARAMVADMARICASTRVALVGDSQGADAAGDPAAEIGTGSGVVSPDRIALVGLISDPSFLAQIEEFLNSGIHQSYPGYVVGPRGETSLSWPRMRLTEAADE